MVYQEALGAILYTLRIAAAKDSGWPVRQAAVEALGKAISVAPQKNTILGALHKVVKDAECKCLQRVFASIGRAISPFPSELGAILHTLCTAANDKRYTVRQAAIQALARVPIEQLIDDYWATNEDRRLVPIAHRLYEISLVITPQSQATLYRAEGNCITWQQPTEALKRFASLIKYKATQMIIMKSLKTVPQRPQDYARWLESIQAFGLGNHPEVASVLRMVATAYHDVGQYEESVRYFKQALAMQQALHKGKKHDDVAEALIDIGIVCERLDNYEEAFEYYQQAFQMYVGLHKGKSHDDIAKALNYMGVVCERLDNYGEALKYYQQAFQMYRALYKGKNYDDVAKALTDMGIVCERLDNYKEALKYYQQALQTYIALHKGKKHDDVAAALRTVGVAYEGLGQHEQSLDYYQKALAMQRILHEGQNDAQIAQLLKNIGDAYVSLNHLKAAIQNYEQVLAVPVVSKAIKASTGHNLGCMYHVKALAFRKAGDEPQAQAYLEKANTSFEQSIQALEKVNAGVYTEYGNFLLATQKFSQAYDYLHKVIANGDKNNGLSYGLLKQTIVTPVLQAYISQQHKASLRGIDYAYYLMILHYDDFQKAGITMDKTKEEYLAAYQASLDQHKGHPEQAQADRAAYFLLASL